MVWSVVIAVVFSAFVAFFLFYRLIFLRDPKRTIPSGNTVVSPADGRIIAVVGADGDLKIKKGLLGKIQTATKEVGKKCTLVSIFMSPLDAHYNRAPVSGKIISVRHEQGRFLPVNTLEAGLVNEKNEVVIKNKKLGNVKVIQMAGFLARRIHCFVRESQNIDKGQKIGLISLGSQCSLVLPKRVAVTVKQGDSVKAGESVIGVYS